MGSYYLIQYMILLAIVRLHNFKMNETTEVGYGIQKRVIESFVNKEDWVVRQTITANSS